jgi:hypothetical protein
VRPEGLGQLQKNPMTSSGLEPTTFHVQIEAPENHTFFSLRLVLSKFYDVLKAHKSLNVLQNCLYPYPYEQMFKYKV